jgi:hypothetical protein
VQITIDQSELQSRSLFLGVPMYGGMAHMNFISGLMELTRKCQEIGVHLETYFIANESLVQRGRNTIVDQFLQSDCTHLIFIDADIGFDAESVIMMLAMMADHDPYDVLTAPYPKKAISWEKVKCAVEQGVGTEDPAQLANFAGDFAFNLKPGSDGEAATIGLQDPFPVSEAGTGFMMIKRSTFERLRLAFPEKQYVSDLHRSSDFDPGRTLHAYFDCAIDPQTKRYLSEDYYFCRTVWQAGMTVHMCGWMQTTHTGSFTFGGSLAHLAAIGTDPGSGGSA